jgi:hypothetical protein
MKYYTYISDAKVDMLLPQVPHPPKKRIATEFKVDFKVVSAARKREFDTDDNRISRLEAVSDFIFEYGDVGTVDRPGEYIAGTLPMCWRELRNSRTRESAVILFCSETEHTQLALGGSVKHLIGNTPQANADFIGSNLNHLLYFFAKSFEETLSQEGIAQLSDFKELLNKVELESHGQPISERIIAYLSLGTVSLLVWWNFADWSRKPKQNLEFLAKRLLFKESTDGKKQVLLATPIYVAMAD